MKKSFVIILMLLVSMMCAFSIALAQTNLQATATIPNLIPVDIAPVTIRVHGKGTAVTDWEVSSGTADVVTALNFETLELFPRATDSAADKLKWGKYKAFLPNHFFSVDVGFVYASTGTAVTDIYVSYAEGNNPNAAKASPLNRGLGYKSTAYFVKKYWSGGSEADDAPLSAPRKLLNDLIGSGRRRVTVLTDISGGWLRVYLGIV